MIGLRSASHGREQVVPNRSDIEFVHPPTRLRFEPGNHLVACQTDFGVAIEVVIVRVCFDPVLPLFQYRFEMVFGLNQLAEDGISKMGQIDAAERSMPVTAIALPSVERLASLFDLLSGSTFLFGLQEQ